MVEAKLHHAANSNRKIIWLLGSRLQNGPQCVHLLPPLSGDKPEPGTDSAKSTDPETAPMPRTSRQSRNAEVNFRGQKRTYTTHDSITDPDARLYKKSAGSGAMLCFIGHALMEKRYGLIVQGELTQGQWPS